MRLALNRRIDAVPHVLDERSDLPQRSVCLTRSTDTLPLPKFAIRTNFPVLSIEMKQVLVPPVGAVLSSRSLPLEECNRERTHVRRRVQSRPQRERVLTDGIARNGDPAKRLKTKG